MSRLEENFTKFRYQDWLPLSNEDIYQLNEKDFQVINDLQEKFKEDLVDKSYLSMVDLLSINIRNYNRINRKIKDTETSEQKKYPFIIGVAGSVASGKSTFSIILELLLKKSLKGFNIKLLTTDGFLYPNSVLEAMAIGLPVVASGVGAIPEMIEQDNGGYVVNVGEVDKMKEHLKNLSLNPELRKSLGLFNKKKCNSNR